MAGPVWRAAATDTECLDRSQNQDQARCLRPHRPHPPRGAPGPSDGPPRPRQMDRTHPEGEAELGVGSVGSGSEPEPSAADIMATASTSGQSSFGLGKKKKSPGLMDQLSKLFGGEKKKRSKGSFRGHLAASPQQPSARRRTNENAVVHFFRSLVSSPPPKSTWREVLGLSHVGHLFIPCARWDLMTQKRPLHSHTDRFNRRFVQFENNPLSSSLLLDDFETSQLFMTR
ncbi:myelin basic protein-like isoform X1 [Xiphophorus couchianus]|uniref:myelin basic protein-like isoform X1 n=1 Tax=Xiphophorus couchianus TaxID=32473 RepID=UPI001016FEDA|nr:myelin basic protein-like isoform X1 [Xiphophorus couchianus]